MARRSVDVSDLIAKRRQLEKIIENAVLQTAEKLTLDVGKRLIETSPVDSGLFRSSWSINVPKKAYEAGTIQNNTVYGRKLAEGHSPQADDGWIENCLVAAVKFGGNA